MDFGAHAALADYVVDANEALSFRLVRKPADMDDDKVEFKPEMTHQIYGDNENIFGYRGLSIQLAMTAGSLQSYLTFRSEGKVDPAKTDGVEADNVIEPLAKILAPGSLTNTKDDFITYLNSDAETKFRPMGELVHSFTSTIGDEGEQQFEVYKCVESTPGFREYHERLQSWVMFFIDAASFIDIDDDKWRVFLLFQKYSADSGETRYAIAGYVTIYEFYAYGRELNMKRPRVSQMLILPPFQRKGLGAALLKTVYRNYLKDASVLDITVEDPSDNFVRLRDFVDTQNCLKLPEFSRENLAQGFTDKLAQVAAKELKLCKRQARRVYEIIRLKYTGKNDEVGYKNYRVDVKRRLNVPYQKEQSQLEKLRKALKPEEFAAAMVNITNREQRIEMLDKQFKELETYYRMILERVASSVA